MKTAGIVAFAFGAPDTIRPNQWIAEIASQKSRKLNAPVYTQCDVLIKPEIQVEYTEEEPGSLPTTLRMARGAVQWAKQNKFTELWVVAALPHLWRVMRDIKEAIREAEVQINIYFCEEITQHPENTWFCPDSTQGRVRSPKSWYIREIILRFMPFFLYKYIAN